MHRMFSSVVAATERFVMGALRQRGGAEAVDSVITNALIVYHWGVVKADIGIRQGRIAGIGKADMKLNDWQPKVEVDAQTYEVRADGDLLTCEPAKTLPLSQRYFLF